MKKTMDFKYIFYLSVKITGSAMERWRVNTKTTPPSVKSNEGKGWCQAPRGIRIARGTDEKRGKYWWRDGEKMDREIKRRRSEGDGWEQSRGRMEDDGKRVRRDGKVTANRKSMSHCASHLTSGWCIHCPKKHTRTDTHAHTHSCFFMSQQDTH